MIDLALHRAPLLRLAYRMLGTLQDAEDAVQEAFVRALASPPPDLTRDLRPWLMRVVLNVARDRLRRRRTAVDARRWLPEPAPLERVDPELTADRAETVDYAWMVAAESLTPEQRAVVLLRDVLDHDVAETASALDRSAEAVRALHARARRTLAARDPGLRASRPLADVTFAAWLAALASGEPAVVAALMRDDVRMRADDAGRYAAAGVPLDSPGRVARVLVALGRRARPTDTFSVVDVLGTPALRVARAPPLPSRWAPVSVLVPVIDVSGRIAAIYNMLDEGKLTSWPGPMGA